MRPVERVGAAPTPTPTSLWRTPTPYLFLGFAVMMGLIVVALLVLICTRRKEAYESDDKAASLPRVLVPLNREDPKVVVIMAGDAFPSFIAVSAPAAGAEAV